MQEFDLLQRYLFQQADVRGEMVRLQASLTDMLSAQDYPLAVKQLLAEMMAATSLLTAILKFEGEIALQIQSEGLIKYAVINGNHQQQLRGVAKWDQNVESWPQQFSELFEKGVMAITIIPTQGERYQGMVALDKDDLAQCLQAYFAQSEQLATHLKLHTRLSDDTPVAAGVLLQVLPQSSEASQVQDRPEFEHLATLTDTLSAEELFTLPTTELLRRLYHEEDIQLFEAMPVTFKCSCSKQRSAGALANVSKAELLDIIAKEGEIKMNCQYCHNEYRFDGIDIEAIHAGTFKTDIQQQ